jgi:two-component system, cell cycle response regulator
MRNRILIVDDMPEAAMMLMAYLSGEGFDVVTASNGNEALEVLAAQTPHLILSDIMMPKMGGFELIEKIRAQYPDNYIPIIFMSAKNKSVTEPMALDLGAEEYLQKPVSLIVLKSAIDAALQRAAKRNSAAKFTIEDIAAKLNDDPVPCISEIEMTSY